MIVSIGPKSTKTQHALASMNLSAVVMEKPTAMSAMPTMLG